MRQEARRSSFAYKINRGRAVEYMARTVTSTLKSGLGAFIAGAVLMIAPELAIASPTTVTLTGSFQSELGCGGDYTASCALSQLTFDVGDQVWQRGFSLPAGTFSYFVTFDGDIAQNYGQHGNSALDPVSLTLAAAQTVKFYYDDSTHWLTDSVNSDIVMLAGSFQSELGCAGDFSPDCLRSWLQDKDGDGIYTRTSLLPAGAYSTVVTVGESFGEIYGPGGVLNGGNIDFTATGQPVTFSYNSFNHVLTIDNGSGAPVPEPATWTTLIAGMMLAGAALRRRRPFLKAQA